MIKHICAALTLSLTVCGGAHAQNTSHTILSFADLHRWETDDHARALEVFESTCPDIRDAEWQSLCALAQQGPEARTFFELFFRPVLIENGQPGLFTGYYEPELDGALSQSDRYKYPVYQMPNIPKSKGPWLTRREIETGNVMKGKGLEIAWVDDPVELFFMQIQGSGRIKLEDGRRLRVGYGGSNGHYYKSIGRELIRRGVFQPHQASEQAIKSWVRRNPKAGRELLFHNPGYVFFRKLENHPGDAGPLGAMNRPLAAGRTIAIDPAYVPLGSPVWVEKGGKNPLRRLMIAQDTGSAIKGPQRADIFFGTGYTAGRRAGRLRDPGRLIVLLPIDHAYAVLAGLQK